MPNGLGFWIASAKLNASGGRRTWKRHGERRGKLGWLARYLKDVDANETTVRFWQEIYDDKGKLVETHEKFPVDKGH